MKTNSIFGAIFALNFAYASDNNNLISNPLALAQRRTAIRPQNTEYSETPVLTHNFGEYNLHGVGSSFTDNPLSVAGRPSNSNPRTTTDISVAARLFPFPVEKPFPDESFGFDNSETNENGTEDEVYDLLNMIPDRFIVNEAGGTYEINEGDVFITSADVMKKRSALYRLLSEIYGIFDSYDFDGFKRFLAKFKAALEHLDLRYHLIENLVQRSLKTKNIDTLNSLARFIEIIDVSSVCRTVGKEEHETFFNFEKTIKETGKKKQFSDSITSALINYFSNEKKRLFPLRDSLLSGDYNTAKGIIESGNHLIFVSFDDFMILLERPCSSARFSFVSWAISKGHFNVNERFENEFLTPLMFVAMCPRWSNDVVKAILWKAPETQSQRDAAGLTALHYAKNNKHLSLVYRKPLIEMLELKNPNPLIPS